MSKHTIYAWKAKYGGMNVSEAQRLRQLEDENGRLKKLVAELSLDKKMLCLWWGYGQAALIGIEASDLVPPMVENNSNVQSEYEC